eukprot:scaffold139689_cov18-Tisochrysis_lutea.AAC.1
MADAFQPVAKIQRPSANACSNGYRESLSVFLPETGQPQLRPFDRSMMAEWAGGLSCVKTSQAVCCTAPAVNREGVLVNIPEFISKRKACRSMRVLTADNWLKPQTSPLSFASSLLQAITLQPCQRGPGAKGQVRFDHLFQIADNLAEL